MERDDPRLRAQVAERQAMREERRKWMRNTSPWVSIEDFCLDAGISRSTLDRIRKRRTLPEGFPTEYNPTGSRPRFKREEVQRWIEAQPLR